MPRLSFPKRFGLPNEPIDSIHRQTLQDNNHRQPPIQLKRSLINRPLLQQPLLHFFPRPDRPTGQVPWAQ